MKRVERYARRIGPETITDWRGGREWTPELNDQFIEEMMAQGREVIDIGPDFERRLKYKRGDTVNGRPPSEIYGRERQLLRDYPNRRRVYDRQGKYLGGVPGFDEVPR